MNNEIYEVNNDFDFSILNLGNPSLLGNSNNYFSKISHGNMNKNCYFQLPKCITKQGISKGTSKNYCDLLYNSNDKTLIEFFENLENYCIKQICKNKEMWFYDSDSMNDEDIQELMTPIMRSYRSGKNFLIKTNIKLDKFILYDENENKVNLEDYDINYEIIPLININGIKFSSKSFIIELILLQVMIMYPPDNFEKQVLINRNKTSSLVEKNIQNKKDTQLNEDNKDKDNQNNITDINDSDNNVNINSCHDLQDNTENDNLQNKQLENKNSENKNSENKNSENKNPENKNPENDSLKYLTNYEIDDSRNIVNLENLQVDENSKPFEIKSHENIYLEIYKKAMKKAKEIRKNAIDAFLEAKNIKNQYNLSHVLDSDSDDEEMFVNMT